LAGTRCSGFTKVSIVLCGRSYPRIFLFLLNPPLSLNYTDAKQAVDPIGEEFLNILLRVSPAGSGSQASCSFYLVVHVKAAIFQTSAVFSNNHVGQTIIAVGLAAFFEVQHDRHDDIRAIANDYLSV
jgi:hypothetical protein